MFKELTTPLAAERKPWELFFLAIIFSSLAILISIIFFNNQGGINTIVLSILAFIPLMYHALAREERQDTTHTNERFLLREHSKVVLFLIFMFLGMVVSFFAWSLFLPEQTTNQLFALQQEAITSTQHAITGQSIGVDSPLIAIIQKNLNVMFLALLLSLFFGFGALYIVTWNASVVAIAMTNFVHTAGSTGLSVFMSFIRYLTHGLPEILGFLIAGLAGGIFYIAFIQGDLKRKIVRTTIYKDVLALIAYAFLFIISAALIEVYITPLFF